MTYTFPITPVGKPRQTQSDKWKKRPAVMRYRAYADELRAEALSHSLTLESPFKVIFLMPVPKSLSQRKQEALVGNPHAVRPDIDNLLKGFLDSLLENDAGIWDVHAQKFWAQEGRIIVSV